jgi:hypothetical protein
MLQTPELGLSISLMAFSGIRPQVMGNYDGTDGLKQGEKTMKISTTKTLRPFIGRIDIMIPE